MTGSIRRFGPPDPRRFAPAGRRWFYVRLGVYAAVVLGILVFRVMPSLRSKAPVLTFPSADRSLVITGAGLAPELVARLADEYRAEYPAVEITTHAGGTTQALEDLVNRRADVAFLAREPKPEEAKLIRDHGDSVETYPVALGGIAIVAGSASPQGPLDGEGLRRILLGEAEPRRLIVPDPNRGLWDALAQRLELAPGALPANVTWVASETEVLEAVAGDRSALGIASTLALPESLESAGARFVPIRKSPEALAFTANKQEVATGEYPLFHYLYVSCRPGSGALASGFVTFLFSGRGQRLVSRAGYLPAREVPRPIQLTSRPIGSKGM
jgi:phosphate transport system substrate-binding protein